MCLLEKTHYTIQLEQLHGEHWRPAAYASRVLAEAETRYAQIEKEALAVTFACECIRDFITGFEVIVEIDHSPLTAIAQKSLSDMPPYLQRFFFHLMLFNISLQYIPGKDLALADALSRIRCDINEQPESEPEDVAIHATAVLSTLISDSTSKRIARATMEDKELRQVIEVLQDGQSRTVLCRRHTVALLQSYHSEVPAERNVAAST